MGFKTVWVHTSRKGSLSLKVKVLLAQLCSTLCDPRDCSPPGSSVHGILQARIPEWVVIPFSRRSSLPGIKHRSPTVQEILCHLIRVEVPWTCRQISRCYPTYNTKRKRDSVKMSFSIQDLWDKMNDICNWGTRGKNIENWRLYNNFPKFLKDINSQNQESSAIHKQDKYKGNHTYMVHSFWSEIFKVLKKRKISTQNLFKSSLNLLQYCFCFMFYFFWPGGMWDPSSLTTVQTWTPYIGRQSLNFLLPGKSYLRIFYITKLLFKKECKIKTFWNG